LLDKLQQYDTKVWLMLIRKEKMADNIWFHKYRIVKELGHGGSASVYLAEHIKLKTLRAIKVLQKDNILHNQLLQEAHILKNLKHSCIPIIYDFEEDAHNSYIIEQYIEGQSLKVYRQQNLHIPEKIIINYSIQICELLEYLYSIDNPILYLDLKPENIIISNGVVKLIDFGASTRKRDIAERKYSLGTKGYAAPEIYNGRTLDERTDIYGIGTLLYFMIMNQRYDLKSQMQIMNKSFSYSKALHNIMKQCLRFYPCFRYSSIKILKKKLLELSHTNSKYSNNSCESIRIGVAGSEHRIGSTHLSFLINSYLYKNGLKGLYIEKNPTDLSLSIPTRYQNIKIKNDVYQLYHGDILPKHVTDLNLLKTSYDYLIFDYGELNNHNLEEFISADIKLLVCGAKDWEMPYTEDVIKKLDCSKEIKYLFNFLDGNHFKKVLRQMGNLLCYRIPYEPNPFEWKKNKHTEEFIELLLHSSNL
jgi:eukaryotic-like serine/threonine-protein kinase